MSLIEKGNNNIVKKEELKQEDIFKNNQNNNNNKQLEDLKKESINSTKELIKQLLQNKLNNSLLKLESNSSNHINTLKNVSKSFTDFSKLISNLIKKVEETKKKKEKEKDKKGQIFKKVRKIGTERHLISRSRTIESNLVKFKSKAVFGMIENNKKNNNIKTNLKPNNNMKKLGNRTLTNFRLTEEKKEEISQKQNKFQTIVNNTAQNFRKNINMKKGPITPRGLMNEKIRDKNIDKTFIQNNKMNLDSFMNKENKTKKIEYVYEKNVHSKTIILNPLSDIDERIEKYTWNKTKKIIKNREIKGAIYKNDKKSAFVKLNYQLDKINEKNNKLNNNKNIGKEKESNETQVANIVKLVDNVNQNLNKILSENKNIKKNFIKEGNKNLKNEKILDKKQQNNSKILINAIKYTNIKDTDKENIIQNNKNIEIKNDIINNKTLEDNIKNEENKIDHNIKNDNDINDNDKDNHLKKNISENNINKIGFSNNLNTLKNYFENEDRNILILKNNKSSKIIKLMHNISLINNNEIIYNKSTKEIIKKNINKKINNSQDKKDNLKHDNNKKDEMPKENEKIINNLELMKKIRNKMKENNYKINQKIRNKETNEKLNILDEKTNKKIEKNEDDKLISNKNDNIKNNGNEKNKLDLNQQIVDNYNHKNKILQIIKENIHKENLKNYLSSNKSEKKLTKLTINHEDNIIIKSKSYYNILK